MLCGSSKPPKVAPWPTHRACICQYQDYIYFINTQKKPANSCNCYAGLVRSFAQATTTYRTGFNSPLRMWIQCNAVRACCIILIYCKCAARWHIFFRLDRSHIFFLCSRRSEEVHFLIYLWWKTIIDVVFATCHHLCSISSSRMSWRTGKVWPFCSINADMKSLERESRSSTASTWAIPLKRNALLRISTCINELLLSTPLDAVRKSLQCVALTFAICVMIDQVCICTRLCRRIPWIISHMQINWCQFDWMYATVTRFRCESGHARSLAMRWGHVQGVHNSY